MNENELDKQAIIDGFNRAANTYDASAALQREVASRLLERLDVIRYQPKTILDLGTGTGECSLALSQKYPDAHIIALDIASDMLVLAREKLNQQGQARGSAQGTGLWQKLKNQFSSQQSTSSFSYLCADAEFLPLQNKSVDLIFSSLAIQWCEDLGSLFREFQRVLSPEGFILFSTFGVDTLSELKKSWKVVSNKQHVNQFTDMHDIGDSLLQSGFRDPVMDAEFIVVEYDKVIDLMHDLKAIGAHNHLSARAKGLTPKAQLKGMLGAYEQFRLPSGKYPASYEVVYGHAWGRDLSLELERAGSQIVSINDIKPSIKESN